MASLSVVLAESNFSMFLTKTDRAKSALILFCFPAPFSDQKNCAKSVLSVFLLPNAPQDQQPRPLATTNTFPHPFPSSSLQPSHIHLRHPIFNHVFHQQ
jgi:hypothetical protein